MVLLALNLKDSLVFKEHFKESPVTQLSLGNRQHPGANSVLPVPSWEEGGTRKPPYKLESYTLVGFGARSYKLSDSQPSAVFVTGSFVAPLENS